MYINQTVVPQAETVKYLGLHFDKHLTWKNNVATKRKQLELKTREIYWLIGKHSPLSLENMVLIYKTVLKPAWTYRIELWGCAFKANIAVIQRYQSKLLRTNNQCPIVCLQSNPPFRPTHPTCLHGFPVTDSYPSHGPGFAPMEPLVHPPNNRRLKRIWTFDEIH